MAAGRMDRSGEGMTQAGRICGMIATIIMIVELCCVIAYVAVAFFVAIGVGAAGGG
ncbi:MAG: hypothetical protein HYS13_22620 [Planctomycetia bacterium]|nr:hypothetical protein [Planctomycetia bacterium]